MKRFCSVADLKIGNVFHISRNYTLLANKGWCLTVRLDYLVCDVFKDPFDFVELIK